MSEWYFASLLVAAGVCLGFALHAADLTLQSRSRTYLHLLLLALLEAAYCLVTHHYLSETIPETAIPWGQAICLFTPWITFVFGELVIELTGDRPPWLRRFQRINFVLTTLFVAAVAIDMVLASELVLGATLETDLASAHRHRLEFRPFGLAWLAWVGSAFTLFAVLLFRSWGGKRELGPMVLGCVLYFCAVTADFGIFARLRDGYFLQHFGFFLLVVGCWRVLAGRFERSLDEQKAAVERLQAQRQRLLLATPLLQKQKLESLGTLAAGVAHEINNPIHGILNYVQLMKRSLEAGNEARGFALEIEHEANRVASIVKNLLRFGRADDGRAIAADVRIIVQDTVMLLRSPLRESAIVLDVKVDDDVPELVCHMQQLQQVLMNLVVNARDALNLRSEDRTDEKRILIHVEHVVRDGASWVGFNVIDNADGFDADVATRVFDPFFTTKAEGEGTGLGLSISHGIVRAHGGTLTCASEPGRETKFRFELPVDAISLAS